MERIMDTKLKRILIHVFVTLLFYCAVFGISSIGTDAASGKIQIVGTPTVYVQSGCDRIVSIQVKNTTNTELKGVTLAQGFSSMDDYNKYIRGEKYNYTDGSSDQKTTGPDGYETEWYRFQSYFEKSGYEAVNAVWDSDEEGYTIAANKTATLWFKVNSEYENPANYNEWIRLGDIHTEYYNNFFPVPVVDEDYSGQLNVAVNVYNPSGAAIRLGTSSDHGGSISALTNGSTINFGSISLTDTSKLKAEKTYYVRNISTGYNGNIAVDEHGASTDIRVDLSVENDTKTIGSGLIDYPFGCNTSKWAPLPAAPMSAGSFQCATAGVTIDATNYVEGTYTGKLTLATNPHGVKVNGGSVNNKGEYTWPVKVTLTGTNPRIPIAPTNVAATPGNGQVELSWKAAADAEPGRTYWVFRREGSESNSANLNKASFNWDDYEEIGSDTPDDEGNCFFIDGNAVNGKTYTYLIIGGSPLQAYPALSKAVRPLSSLTTKILGPEVNCDEQSGGVLVEWSMNGNYGGDDNDGSSLVDHFNVYRDGVLVAQIKQDSFVENNSYGYVEDPVTGIVSYQITGSSYSWETFVETPITYQDYTWNVSCVSKSGVEGHWSESIQGRGFSDSKCVISGHNAVVSFDYDDNRLVNTASLKVETYYSPEKVEYWRAVGKSAPDTTGAPFYQKTDTKYDVETELIDKSIVGGETYTYAARVTDTEGNVSDIYTFSIKVPNKSDWCYEPYSSTEVSWSIVDGKKAKLKWYADDSYDDEGSFYYRGTYYVYCDGKKIQTFGVGDSDYGAFSYTHDPGTDGTHVYRIDKDINGLYIQGREFTFVRNTTKVNEDDLLKAPSAPILDVRVSEGNPVLYWAATDKGGAVEGYHIYRKDAGQFVNGRYEYSPNPWSSSYKRYWNNKRYITIQDKDASTLVDKYGAYMGDEKYGELYGVSWAEDSCPHEYWITAYNRAGESAPSKVVTFDFQGEHGDDTANPPASNDEYKPGTPIVKKVWVDWNDTSDRHSDWDTDIDGKVHVAWEDAASSTGSINSWTVILNGLRNTYDDLDLYGWEAAMYSGAKNGTADCSPFKNVAAGHGDNADYGRTVTASVKAVNSAGSTTSASFGPTTIYSFPRFRVNGGNGYAKLEWTDLFKESSNVTVSKWKIMRKRESASWQTVTTLDASDVHYEKKNGTEISDSNGTKHYAWKDKNVSNGWKYEYKVVAVCSDGVERSSVLREVTPAKTSAAEAPGAPQKLGYEVVNGEVILTWDPPATGEAQYYKLVYGEVEGDNVDWNGGGWVHAPSTSMVWSYMSPGTYRFSVYAYSYINGDSVPKTDIHADNLDEMYPNHSNIVEVTLTQEDIDKLADEYPGDIELTATAGDSQVTLNWNKVERATNYELRRYIVGDDDDDFGSVSLPASVTTYTDLSAMAGVRYEYRLYACNFRGDVYESVVAVPSGTSKDQTIAGEVAKLISDLPKPASVAIGDKDAIDTAKDRYDGLTVKQQKLISSELRQKLEDCIEKIKDLEALSKYQDLVAPVQSKINNLPDADSITGDNLSEVKPAVEQVRDAYDAITPSEAKRIVDTTKLVAAERRIDALEKEAADRILVDDLLTDLRNLESASDVNEANAEEVLGKAEALQTRIGALSDSQRSMFEGDGDSAALVNKLNETVNKANAILGREHEHIMQKVSASKSTCTKNGYRAHYRCTACGGYFSDAEGQHTLSPDEVMLPLDAAAHEWGEWTATSTALCTTGGIEQRVCKHNNKHVESRTVPAQGHKWDNGTVIKESTPTENGQIQYECTVCHEKRIDIVDKLVAGACPTLGEHTWGNGVVQKEANCTEKGEIVYTCTKCNVIRRYETDTDPTKHVWRNADKDEGWAVETAASCTASGNEARQCALCSARETRVLAALGHDWDVTVDTPSTCCATGTRTLTCKRRNCGVIETEEIPIDPNTHDWSEWSKVRNASCTEGNLEKRTCNNNPAHSQTRTTQKALGHSWSGWNTVQPPTEESQGLASHRCSRCGNSESIAIAPITLPTDLPGVKISKPAKGKKAITVKWKKPKKKQLKQIGGIEIQVTGPSGTITATAGKKKSSKKIKGLLPKQTYSCRVRAYNYIGGVKHVSAWSNWKTVKTK